MLSRQLVPCEEIGERSMIWNVDCRTSAPVRCLNWSAVSESGLSSRQLGLLCYRGNLPCEEVATIFYVILWYESERIMNVIHTEREKEREDGEDFRRYKRTHLPLPRKGQTVMRKLRMSRIPIIITKNLSRARIHRIANLTNGFTPHGHALDARLKMCRDSCTTIQLKSHAIEQERV